ncbi:hypothetical protein [Dongshaea marina]|uniref:hypothetical protein n=1 Tax=Dongshaea marina TaxID=2047966 RepID=UPI000D3E77A9|nr:hypothetical protein [Dongshaea marina]
MIKYTAPLLFLFFSLNSYAGYTLKVLCRTYDPDTGTLINTPCNTGTNPNSDIKKIKVHQTCRYIFDIYKHTDTYLTPVVGRSGAYDSANKCPNHYTFKSNEVTITLENGKVINLGEEKKRQEIVGLHYENGGWNVTKTAEIS